MQMEQGQYLQHISLLNISAGDHTTTEDSLDGGVTLTSKTEVQKTVNYLWIRFIMWTTNIRTR